jgi:diguanylate cyclase (GGDEF)-like protein
MAADRETDTVLIIDPHARGARDYRDAVLREIGYRSVLEASSMEAALAQHIDSLACVLIDPLVEGFQPEKLKALVQRNGGGAVPVVLILNPSIPEGRFDELERETFDVVIRGEREEGDARRAVRNGLELVALRRMARSGVNGSNHEDTVQGFGTRQPRELFRAALTEALSNAGEGNHIGVMLIGLDDFKAINTAFGHGEGETLLAKVERRLRHSIRNVDTLLIWSSDEFALLLDEMYRPDDATVVVQRIQYALSRSFQYAGHELYLTASIGIAVNPEGGTDEKTLLQHADAALYRVRKAGGNGFERFSRDNQAGAQTRIELVTGLRNALKRAEFELYYQPILDVSEGRVAGLEALLRWNDPQTGFRSPAEFIPLLEETGLILPVGEWALRRACTQVRAWQYAGLKNLKVSVNVSARQFRDPTFVETVTGILKETGLEPETLQIELTESVLMDDARRSVDILSRLHSLGVILALDDFGTGYSSLAQLKDLPVDVLKIDRAFIKDTGTDGEGRAICSAIVRLADALKLRVVAEGVEEEQQLRFLMEQGCPLIQGFLLARPMSADKVWAWLTEDRPSEEPAGRA